MSEAGGIKEFIQKVSGRRKTTGVVHQTGLQLSLYAETHTIGEILQRIIDEAEMQTGSSIGFLHFLADDQQTLSLQAWSTNTLHYMCTAESFEKHYALNKAGVWTDCVKQRKTVIHNDISKLTHRKGFPEGHANVVREMVTPVIRGEKIVAILGVGNKNNHYTREDEEILVQIADLTWDIIQRKWAEERLAVKEKWYKAIFDHSPAGVLIMDKEGSIIDFNPAISLSSGYPREELIGANIRILEPEGNNESDKETIQEIYEGYHLLHTVENVKKDGTPFWMERNETRIDLPDGGDGILMVSNDITKRIIAEQELVKAKKKAEENNRIKAIFLSNMSHELRTPLNVLMGFLSLLKDMTLSEEERQEYIDVIMRNGSRLLETINDIIEISKIEIGNADIQKENIDLDAFMTEIHLKYYIEITDKSLYFKYIKPVTAISENSVIIYTDALKLYGILNRLITNAIKFTEQGGIETGFYLLEKEVVIYVKDTGVGIPEDYHEAVFEQFNKAGQDVNRGKEGSGLGLPIAKAYCELLGGSMKLKSAPGAGSVFSFTLPYQNDGK